MKKSLSFLAAICLMMMAVSHAQIVLTGGPNTGGGGSSIGGTTGGTSTTICTTCECLGTCTDVCSGSNPPCYCTDSCNPDVCNVPNPPCECTGTCDLGCFGNNPPASCEPACSLKHWECLSGTASAQATPIYPNKNYTWQCTSSLSGRNLACTETMKNTCVTTTFTAQPSSFAEICSIGGFISTGASLETVNGVQTHYFSGYCPDSPQYHQCKYNIGNLIRINALNGADSQSVDADGIASFSVTVRNINAEPLRNVIISSSPAVNCSLTSAQTGSRYSGGATVQFDSDESFSYTCTISDVVAATFPSGKLTVSVTGTGTISNQQKNAVDSTAITVKGATTGGTVDTSTSGTSTTSPTSTTTSGTVGTTSGTSSSTSGTGTSGSGSSTTSGSSLSTSGTGSSTTGTGPSTSGTNNTTGNSTTSGSSTSGTTTSGANSSSSGSSAGINGDTPSSSSSSTSVSSSATSGNISSNSGFTGSTSDMGQETAGVIVPVLPPDELFSEIEGQLYYDENKNGIVNPGEGVAGAQIEISRKDLNAKWYNKTDVQGYFKVTRVPDGKYDLRITGTTDVFFPEVIPIVIEGGNFSGNFSGFRNKDIIDNPDIKNIFNLYIPDNQSGSGTTGGSGGGTGGTVPIDDITDVVDPGPTLDNPYYGDTEIGGINSIETPMVGEVTQNAFLSYLENGFSLDESLYSPVILALIERKNSLTASNLCGNGAIDFGEVCDDFDMNGEVGYCSSNCLYIDRATPIIGRLSSSALGIANSNTPNSRDLGIVESIRKNTVFQQVASAGIVRKSIQILDDVVGIENIKSAAKTAIAVAEVAAETAVVVAEYSVVGVTSLLGVAAVGSNFMVYKAHWMKYTVQEGDTLESLSDKFTMTTRKIGLRNSMLRKGGKLEPGMRITVRNRHFMEKDYLDQLKFVLKDVLETRHLGKLGKNITKEKMNAIDHGLDVSFDFARKYMSPVFNTLGSIMRKIV